MISDKRLPHKIGPSIKWLMAWSVVIFVMFFVLNLVGPKPFDFEFLFYYVVSVAGFFLALIAINALGGVEWDDRNIYVIGPFSHFAPSLRKKFSISSVDGIYSATYNHFINGFDQISPFKTVALISSERSTPLFISFEFHDQSSIRELIADVSRNGKVRLARNIEDFMASDKDFPMLGVI